MWRFHSNIYRITNATFTQSLPNTEEQGRFSNSFYEASIIPVTKPNKTIQKKKATDHYNS